MIVSLPRGITPGGIEKTPVGVVVVRSPGKIRAVCVMLSFQRITIAVPHAPAATPTTSKVRMNRYFMRIRSSRFHFFRSRGSEQLVDGRGALGRTVHRHAEAIVAEARVVRAALREPRKPAK